MWTATGFEHRHDTAFAVSVRLAASPPFWSVNRSGIGTVWKADRVSNGICIVRNALRHLGQSAGRCEISKILLATFDSLTGRQSIHRWVVVIPSLL